LPGAQQKLTIGMGTVIFIGRTPAASIEIVAATVVCSHLLYNQSMLVGNVQKETPLGMTKS
jgi:hypothetical protein